MSLSSLIVQREVASMRQVEEALARQVIYGGDLVTNLLEVARVDEVVLTLLLAESMRLAPAPAEQLRFALGMNLEQRAAPAVRVHQAMARAYGVPLDRRMLRLIARLGGDSPDAGSTPPPLGSAPGVPE